MIPQRVMVFTMLTMPTSESAKQRNAQKRTRKDRRCRGPKGGGSTERKLPRLEALELG